MRIGPQTITRCPICREQITGTETQLPYLVNQHLDLHGRMLVTETELWLSTSERT